MTESRSIDLHGCTVHEAIAQFVDFYNNCVRGGYRGCIEVVHGYGSSGVGGKIRQELRRYLARNSACLEIYVPGNLGNPGITRVYPKRLLPVTPNRAPGQNSDQATRAREAILNFCETPKSRERVFSKLAGRFGDRVLRDEISRMIRDGLLNEDGPKLKRN
jgi:hypothetical protein